MRVKRNMMAVFGAAAVLVGALPGAGAAAAQPAGDSSSAVVRLSDGRAVQMWAETPDGQTQPLELSGAASGEVAVRDAMGCTAAPGGIGAQNCVTVVNSSPLGGTGLAYAFSNYLSASDNVCAITAQFKYTDRTADPNKTKTMTTSSCFYGGSQIKWDPADFALQHGSDFCARQKNSATGQVYSNWACVRIIA